MTSFHSTARGPRALATAVSIAALSAGWLWAAQARAQSAPAADQGSTLSEVVVTAQRRSEVAQKVPIPISVITANSAAAMGVTDSSSLTGMVPSLNISTEGPEMVSLRGIATTGTSINQEQSVASYLDGVYLYNSWGNNFPVNGIDHVEVLYGPQGTLFGRNTTGGVIQYVTRNPTNDAIEASVGYANYDTLTAQAYLSHKFSDDFAANIAVDYRNQGQGYGFNPVSGTKTFRNDYASVQMKAIWQPTTTTKLTGLFWYNHYQGDGTNNVLLPGTRGIDGQVYNIPRYQELANTPNGETDTSYMGYLRLDQDLGFAKFVSLTGFRKLDNLFLLDQDTLPDVTALNAHMPQPSENFSQEFQLLSPSGSRITWLIGAYYFYATASMKPALFQGTDFGPSTTSYLSLWDTQATKSGAVFGQATAPIGHRTNLTVGLRYTDETEYQRGTSSFNGATIPQTDQSTDSSGLTGRVSIDHKFTENVMGYLSYNRGLKSGGFSIVGPGDSPPYRPEHLDAFEVGMKSEAFDHRLRFNASAFYYDFSNIQVETVNVIGVSTTNAAAASIYGADFDVEAVPVKNLTLTATLGVLHSQFDRFDSAGYYLLNPYTAAQVPVGVTCPAPPPGGPGGASECAFNAKGKKLPFAPEVTGTLGASYKLPTEIGTFTVDGLLSYVGVQYQGPDNLYGIPSHALVNASLTWTSLNEHYSVRVWSKNLFDEHYYNDVIEETVGILEIQGDPRTVGVTLSGKF